MQEDPYVQMVDLMRRAAGGASVDLAIAQVTRRSPLTISLGGMLFAGAELRVNASLLDGESQKVVLAGGGDTTTGTLTVTQSALQVGDQVLAVSPDGWNTICVLCRMVSA